MQIVSKNELITNRKSFYPQLIECLFVYPTDHGYSLGCDATNEQLVNKARELKKTRTQPLSIIPPSKEWIYEHCEVSDFMRDKIEELYELDEDRDFAATLILKTKNKPVAQSVNNGLGTIGVKVLNHWMRKVIEKLDTPIISTGANPVGGNFASKLKHLTSHIENGINLCIDEGETKVLPTMILKDE